ncbi:transposon Tf2-1 polyprotein isoform X1 [Cucumis melo var. makuwa]|uniref:Transposon Tf2-1 polyprotein isoform X1 n=1 Tax=Cucumis melo var. makuwa TaxID=1194695 RepID=A0A5D3CTG0_CUCMM|nr:transposon Tf2-1 polyprotein isoform X1 [Cucumis melo var. makuwa]TYK14785.1 transposon Tf2-1 polyprotein isoform X1 [Cucumis melo var. makuwa]
MTEYARRKTTTAATDLDEEPGSIKYESRNSTAATPGSSSKMKENGGKKFLNESTGEEGSEESKKKEKEEDDKIVDRSKFKKVEISVFRGNDPNSWLFKADRYFQIYKLTDSKKIVSVISFDGPSLDWFRSQEERDKFKDWSDLKIQLLERFRSIREGSLYGRFFAIKQTTTVEEYLNLFDRLVVPLSDLSNRVLEETFMNGLFLWIRAEVEYYEPVGLPKMMR